MAGPNFKAALLDLLGGAPTSNGAPSPGSDDDARAIAEAVALGAGVPQVQFANRAATITAAAQIQDGIVTNAKLAQSQAFFDKMDQATAAAWIYQSPLIYEAIHGTGGAGTDEGSFIVASSTISDGAVSGGLLNAVTGSFASIGIDLAAGTVVEIVAKIKVTGFAGIAAGHTIGIGLSANPTPATDFLKTGNAQRIIVGVDTSGDIFLITGSGAGVTATDTGANAVSGTAFKVKIVWTVGTSVAVSIDGGAATTVATTLPVRLDRHMIGGSTLGAIATKDARSYGGAIRITTA